MTVMTFVMVGVVNARKIVDVCKDKAAGPAVDVASLVVLNNLLSNIAVIILCRKIDCGPWLGLFISKTLLQLYNVNLVLVLTECGVCWSL